MADTVWLLALARKDMESLPRAARGPKFGVVSGATQSDAGVCEPKK